MKTKIVQHINKEYRVLWKDGEVHGGYKDFNTKKQAQQYINTLK